MPEIRQNLVTKDWVIIATERAKRPEDFKKKENLGVPLPEYEKNCPFCPGNEVMSSEELCRIERGGKWQVRIIPNKFPALSKMGERIRTVDGIKRKLTGVGLHEVVIETPRHNVTTALLPVEDVLDILKIYKQRYNRIQATDKRIEMIIIFKNHGEGAGTSLNHPHSQIVATPVVPSQIRERVYESQKYFDENLECVMCRIIKEEKNDGTRIVFETEHFVSFVPYAALSPFHCWILPKRHCASFGEISEAELNDMSGHLKTVLSKYYYGLANPDFNYVIRSSPSDLITSDYFHWYLTIVPRLSKSAGFELGSGMFINSSLPENDAAFLRGVKIP